MIYRFDITGAFGKLRTEELRLDPNPKQVKLIKEFMLAIAPQVTESSLRLDRDPHQNAENTMRWAMHLAITYEAFRKIAAEDAPEVGQQSPGESSPHILQGQVGVSAPEPPLHDLRGHSY